MSWVKLDDQIMTHPKILRAGRDARDLFIAGLCFCAGQLTDGVIPLGALRMLGGIADIDDVSASSERLVAVGLWEQAEDGGYLVHDYLDYQPSRERSEQIRQARQQAGSKGGRRSVSTREANAQAKSQQISTPSPYPYPLSDPIVDTDGGDTSGERTQTLAPVASASAAPTLGALALAPTPRSENVVPLQPIPSIPKLTTPPSMLPAPPASAKRTRAPDPLWDACVAVCDGDGNGPTNDSERGKWNKGLKSLRQSGATPDEITLRAGRYRQRYGPGIALNPNALANNWSTLSTEVSDHEQQHKQHTNNNGGGTRFNGRGRGGSSQPYQGYQGYQGPHLPDADEWREWARKEREAGRPVIGG